MIRKVLSVLGGLLVLAAVLVVINSLHVGRYQVGSRSWTELGLQN